MIIETTTENKEEKRFKCKRQINENIKGKVNNLKTKERKRPTEIGRKKCREETRRL